MKKMSAIILKELTLIVRDRTGLLLLLVAPVALALVLAFALGGLGGNSEPSIREIPVIVVNQDEGELGSRLLTVLRSPELGSLLTVSEMSDLNAARSAVDADKSATVIIVPANLSQCFQTAADECAEITLYVNPGRSVTVDVVRGIIDQFVHRSAASSLAARVTVQQLMSSGKLEPQRSTGQVPTAAAAAAEYADSHTLVSIATQTGSAAQQEPFDYLAYYMPATAVLFLMFTLTSGSRSMHAEKESGTLVRLLAAPLTPAQIISGKMLGVIAIGLCQMAILVLFSYVVLGVNWGNPLGVVIHLVLTVSAIASMGLMISGMTRTSQQADAVGMMVTMILAALGGNFIVRASYPPIVRTISLVGPNAWALTGFQKLREGAALAQMAPEFIALAVMTILFSLIAVRTMRRRLQ